MKTANSVLTVGLAALFSTASSELRVAVSTNMDMVVSAHYLATEAGEQVLADGGSAVDAMVSCFWFVDGLWRRYKTK